MYKAPLECDIEKNIPDVFVFRDGTRVTNKESWKKRAEEIKGMYEYYMYGPLPSPLQERISFTLGEMEQKEQNLVLPDGERLHAVVKTARLLINVTDGIREASFEAMVCLPIQESAMGGYPVYVEMSFVWPGRELELSVNAYYAATRGYAAICYNPVTVAEDKVGRKGAFYDLYPYGTDWKEQTGVLAAWGWGASKILDVLEIGLADRLHLSEENTILSGVSRFGKATLVAGAYDKRIKVVVPACSGAGGAAMYRYRSKGNTYDLSAIGYTDENGSSRYRVSQNEALANLQSGAEQHWFNDTFLEFDCEERLPLDQHALAALIADENRYLFMISAATEEDWVNAAAMGLTFLKAGKVFEFLGLNSHACLCEHLKGHAVLLGDMVKLLNYCDKIFSGAPKGEIQEIANSLQTSVFWKSDTVANNI